MFKITIESDEQKEPLILECEHVSVAQERGVIQFYEFGHYDQLHVQPNGHERALIKAWSGCNKYEDFIASTIALASPGCRGDEKNEVTACSAD